MHQGGTLKNLGGSPSAEEHMRIVLTIKGRVRTHWLPPRGRDGHLSSC